MSAPERCPCCGGEVRGNRYELAYIRPPVLALFNVCIVCEAVLRGDDPAAHDALVMAATRRIGGCDAPTVH